jgi:hypothetical protein
MPRKAKSTYKGKVKRNYTKKVSTGKIKANKTQIDGIKFASQLEAFTYKQLKLAGLEFDYEPRSYEIFPKFVYPGETWEQVGKKPDLENKELKTILPITYTPDFVAKDESWVIECKGFANDRFPYVWKMFKHRLTKGKKMPALFVPKNQKQVLFSIQRILELQGC